MIEHTLSPWISLRTFPPGRVLVAAREVRERAEARKLERLVKQVTLVIAAARELVALERRWQMERAARQKRPQGRPEAVALDKQLDSALGGFYEELRGKTRSSRPGSERTARAARMLRTLFPQGVSALMHLSFEEELAGTRDILDVLAGELADDVTALALDESVEHIRELTEAFAETLRFSAEQPLVTWDQVSAAQTRCQETWLGVVAIILGEYPGQAADEIEHRTALLEPIRQQSEALARAFKRRRTVVDVDPDTGHELDPDAPASEAAQPADAPQTAPEAS